MSIEAKVQGNSAQLIIKDRFDASSYQDFKHYYTPLIASSAVRSIEVDVSALNYMDSAALGMLMQLDVVAKDAGKTITLIGVPGRVSNILKMAHADKLFTINLPNGVKMNLRD